MDVHGRPVEEWRKQAFDFAADSTKQLITVITGVVTVTVLFSKDLDSPARWLALVAWALQIISIGLGLFGLLTLSGNLHNAAIGEYRDPSLNAWDVNFFSLWQCILFLFGMLFVLIFGVFAVRAHPTSENNKPLTVTCVLPATNSVTPAPPTPCSCPVSDCRVRKHAHHNQPCDVNVPNKTLEK
jgi:hypothetical protein